MMNTLAYALSGSALFMSILLFIRAPIPPIGFLVMFFKLIAGALSPFWGVMGFMGAAMGGLYGAYAAIPAGLAGAGVMSWYVWQCKRDHKGFENAFGKDWSNRITPQQTGRMVAKRWSWFLKMKTPPKPVWERDVIFRTIPGTDRRLLCDIWRPADKNASGLGIIYFHGSAWHKFDKDLGTRPFFHHLAAQGHTIMDVSYRLCPEVNIYGMIDDIKQSIAWMKTNASRFGVNPEKIVLSGASAGAHLALLAAYTPKHPELTPKDLKKTDLSVCGVFSYYAPVDLLACYEYEKQERYANLPPVPIGDPDYIPREQDVGRLDTLLGGHPGDVPHMYALASPVTHVNSGCPPTLLMQGDQDFLVPVDAARNLYKKLVESGVPAINVIFPKTDHIFDLVLPQVNPAAQSALYDVDRFLALLNNEN